MATTPTQRTLAHLRKNGWTCAIVEHWNSFVKRRQDLFGGIDILCLRPGETLGVQATSAKNTAARITKLRAEPKMRAWVEAGNRLQVIGWSMKGARGKRKLWTPTVTELTLVELAPATGGET